jgi:hypothetical protein
VATTWTDAELNANVDYKRARIVKVGLHTGDPGAAGTSNEASGGSYARVTLSWNAGGADGPLGSSDQPATVGVAWAAPTFSHAAGTYTWLSFWNTGDVFIGKRDLPTPIVASGAGTTQVSLPLNAQPL